MDFTPYRVVAKPSSPVQDKCQKLQNAFSTCLSLPNIRGQYQTQEPDAGKQVSDIVNLLRTHPACDFGTPTKILAATTSSQWQSARRYKDYANHSQRSVRGTLQACRGGRSGLRINKTSSTGCTMRRQTAEHEVYQVLRFNIGTDVTAYAYAKNV